jgi:Uma2 family endonuclease
MAIAKTLQAPFIQQRAWPEQSKWTYQEYRQLPEDGWRYEVIEGELVMTPPPAYQHQRASAKLHVAMANFCESRNLGEVYAAPIEVLLAPDTPVQPDLVFISASRLNDLIRDQGLAGAPDLIVEILSPSNWYIDRRDKFKLYEASGVREYWIVDPKAATIEVFVLRQGQYEALGKFGAGEAARSETLAGFEIAITQIIKV